jgi:uncharacterized protein (DUF1015 family)
MPTVSPFVGLLFDRSVVGSHDQVTTPPYDVISPAERRRYVEINPFNVIRLVLPEERSDDEDGNTKYRRAGDELRAWLRRGALVPTDGPAYFPYEMRFSLHGQPRRVRGLVCAVELDGGPILPHEQTRPEPIEDRLRLMRAIGVNLSSIYAVFRGPNGPLARFLADWADRDPAVWETDEAGVEHRLWVCPPNRELARWLEGEPLMIADGHHRFQMALRFRDEMRVTHGPGPWDRVMMMLVDASAEGPPVLPFHRVQAAGPVGALGDRVRDLEEVLETVRDEEGTFGIVTRDGGMLVHRVAALTGEPPTVCRLHEQVLGGLDAELRFTPDAVEAETAVRAARAVAAYLLPPTDANRIRAVIDRGGLLPRKSTFFWPKPRTGSVIRPVTLEPPTD